MMDLTSSLQEWQCPGLSSHDDSGKVCVLSLAHGEHPQLYQSRRSRMEGISFSYHGDLNASPYEQPAGAFLGDIQSRRHSDVDRLSQKSFYIYSMFFPCRYTNRLLFANQGLFINILLCGLPVNNMALLCGQAVNNLLIAVSLLTPPPVSLLTLPPHSRVVSLLTPTIYNYRQLQTKDSSIASLLLLKIWG